MASTKVSKKKYPSYGVWKYPCNNVIRGRECGGERRTTYVRKWEQLDGAPPGTPDPRRPYRSYICVRCKDEIRLPLGPGAAYSPTEGRPDVSEYSQKATKDPFNKADPDVRAIITEAQRHVR